MHRELPNRKSIRLSGYDYAQAGWYFVTVCVQGHRHLFGRVVDGHMEMNEWGRVVAEEWFKTEKIRSNVKLDEFVVMPNHIHGIITVGATRWVARNLPANSDFGAHSGDRATHRVAPTLGRGSLGAIIGQFKSNVTKRINAIRNTAGYPIWQRNYHEHIIRDELAYDQIRQYIRTNPQNWDNDIYHTKP